MTRRFSMPPRLCWRKPPAAAKPGVSPTRSSFTRTGSWYAHRLSSTRNSRPRSRDCGRTEDEIPKRLADPSAIMSLRGRRFTVAVAIVAVAIPLTLAYLLRDRIREEWLLHRFQTADNEGRFEILEEFSKLERLSTR